MKRLLTVALGVALCSLATAANARPERLSAVPSDAYTYDFGNDDNRPSRTPARESPVRTRAAIAAAMWPAAASARRQVQPHRRQASQRNRGTPMAQRGFTRMPRRCIARLLDAGRPRPARPHRGAVR